MPEVKSKGRNLMSRMGGGRHGRSHSADFSYDPLSYALNFDEGPATTADSNFDDFVAKLPVSPPRWRAIRDLELRSSPRKSAAAPSPPIKSIDGLSAAKKKDVESPAAGKRSSASPTGGRSSVELPLPVISLDEMVRV